MSIWDNGDKNGFMHETSQNRGQINERTLLGKYIYEMAINPDNVHFLEIGTWNGLGSTKCFVDGLSKRNTPYLFYSLECNSEKAMFAKNLYKNYENVHILNEVLLNKMPEDIYEIFPELENKTFRHYNDIDYKNMSDKPLFFERNDLPPAFDVVLLDGGEFTTWYEFLIIKDKCKYLLLDDTNVPKCKKIVSVLKNDDSWKCLFESNERNGTCAFEKLQ